MKIICHSCNSENLFLFKNFNNFLNVSSDCQKLNLKSELILCKDCNLLQKNCSKNWNQEKSKIYKNYKMYSQSSNLLEQKVLSNGKFESRSSLILKWVKKKYKINEKGRFLDFGCGIGNTLLTAENFFTNWEIFGYEPKKKNIEDFLKIRNKKRILSKLKSSHKFNLITLIHVLEHITKPKDVLKKISSLLEENGLCVIQVPYFINNPFDLIIYDHCSHFEPSNFFHLCEKTGLSIDSIDNYPIKKELTIVLKKHKIKDKPLNKILNKKKLITKQINWLGKVLTKMPKKSHCKRGIFGTSIASAWVSNNINSSIDFYVDEDESRINNTFLKKRIIDSANIPEFSSLYIPLTYEIAKLIKTKIKKKNIRIVTSPVLK